MIRFLFMSFIVFSCTWLIGAQTKSSREVGPSGCAVSKFTFGCPQGFDVKNAQGKSEPFLAVERTKKIAVFAFSSDVTQEQEALIVEALSKTFAGLYGSDFKELELKDSRDFSGDEKFSTYEKGKFAKAALDQRQNLAFHFHYVLLHYKDEQIVVGFIHDPTHSKNPTEWYNGWRGGGFGDASKALQDLIVLITKEKRPEFSPGGPPPPGLF